MVSIGHVVPEKKRIEIDIPPDYINKEIEILIQPVEHGRERKSKKESILALKGILGERKYQPEMKREAWEKAIVFLASPFFS
jgi:hypothetical protein